MIDIDNLEATADASLAMALTVYRRDGYNAPTLIVSTMWMDLICSLPGGHPGDNAGQVLGRLASIFDVRGALLITEAWHRPFVGDDTRLARGDLEKMHEAGDVEVHTAITVVVTDGDHVVARFYDADDDKPLDLHRLEGYLMEVLPAAIMAGRGVRHEHPPTAEMYAYFAAMTPEQAGQLIGETMTAVGAVESMLVAVNPAYPYN